MKSLMGTHKISSNWNKEDFALLPQLSNTRVKRLQLKLTTSITGHFNTNHAIERQRHGRYGDVLGDMP